MQTQTPRLNVELLEQRLLAGTYVGFSLSKLSPDTGLPEFPGNVSELSLINRVPKGGTPRNFLGIDLVINATIPRDNGTPGGKNATTTTATVAAASPVADNGVRNQGPSDLFSTLDSHPLFQKNAGPLSGDLGAPSGNNAPAGPVQTATSATATSPIPTNYTSSDGGAGLGAAAPSAAPTSPPPVVVSVSASMNQTTLEAVAVANRLSSTGPPVAKTLGAVSPVTGPDVNGLTVPMEHPRIFWTPDLLAKARDWFQTNWESTFRPSSIMDYAFLYVVTGDQSAAQVVIDALVNFTISDSELQGVASDNYRWNDWVPVTYDWVYDAMTPRQRRTIMDRYNGYVEIMMGKSWGGPGMDANNYYWGYFRNEVNWAIATYYENPMAQTFLDDALVTRWQNSFLPYAADGGRGGVAAEGSQYGPYMLSYPILPLNTLSNLGRNLLDETNYYKEALVNLIYTTSPAPTYQKGNSVPYYQVFPFGDDETNGGYPAAASQYLGNFMSLVADHWADQPIGQYARAWLNLTNADTDWPNATRDNFAGGDELSLDNLPTDYYASGPGYFYTRNQWGPEATNVFLQLGQPTGGSHGQLDTGSFQLWRNGYYLSKASTGYETQFNGGTSEDTIAHNGILFGGMGQIWQRDADPEVLRLQSNDLFSYAAVDLSGTYRGLNQGRQDNPYADHVVREFIYVKPLETMFILDRLKSSSDAIPASQVDKTFLLHFPEMPYQDGPNSVVGVNGDQVLRLTNLGQQPTYNIVDEGAFDGHHDQSSYYQYRLEATVSGQPQSYFLSVLQARGVDEADVTSHMTQDANSWTITLDHPTKGHAKIVLNKGMDSFGGAIGYSPYRTPTNLVPLLDHVQDIQVTNDGPVWGS